MFKYLTDYNSVLLEKFSDEKLKSIALKIKLASTACDVAFWTIFFASFSFNSYINFAVFVICSYLLAYKKMGWMFVNWITWHELTKEEKIDLQKEDYYSIVRQMLENNLDTPVFVAHIKHLKNQENKEIELKNKEEVYKFVLDSKTNDDPYFGKSKWYDWKPWGNYAKAYPATDESYKTSDAYGAKLQRESLDIFFNVWYITISNEVIIILCDHLFRFTRKYLYIINSRKY